MILQALKNMYPKASEKVLRAVMKDLEKCRGKNMSTEELADWIRIPILGLSDNLTNLVLRR